MKKVGICTLHDASPNFGATLQAFSLQQVVKKMGYDVEFLKFKEPQKKQKREIKLRLKKCYPNPKFTPVDTRKIEINSKITDSSKYLNICEEIYNPEKHNYDSIILGSDELWNLKNPSFIHEKEYYGYGLNCNNVFTYAPSSNGTDKKLFDEYFKNEINLDNIKRFSARDKGTSKFIKEVTGADAELVLDPTLLMENFDEYAVEPEDEGYILIYDYKVLPDRKEKIQQLAKSKNLKIYSIGFYNAWADRNINADIFEFLGYVKKASYIVTATFHGTLFSIIFEKQFATTAGNSTKINDILERLNLKSRDITNVKNIEHLIDELIDYSEVEKLKLENRRKSMEYLEKSLNGEI